MSPMHPPPQKAMEQEEGDEEEEKETKPDPLHQLILHFSRTALTEKRFDRDAFTHKFGSLIILYVF